MFNLNSLCGWKTACTVEHGSRELRSLRALFVQLHLRHESGPDDSALAAEGKSQSPINIELDLKQAELPSIGWNLQAGTGDVAVTATTESSEEGREFYNGHTFEVEDLGAPTIVLDGIT